MLVAVVVATRGQLILGLVVVSAGGKIILIAVVVALRLIGGGVAGGGAGAVAGGCLSMASRTSTSTSTSTIVVSKPSVPRDATESSTSSPAGVPGVPRTAFETRPAAVGFLDRVNLGVCWLPGRVRLRCLDVQLGLQPWNQGEERGSDVGVRTPTGKHDVVRVGRARRRPFDPITLAHQPDHRLRVHPSVRDASILEELCHCDAKRPHIRSLCELELFHCFGCRPAHREDASL